jgi:site-specific DNA recombinase
MIAAARQKISPFEAILVWKLSRFARNREDSIIYKSLLRKHGIQVISIIDVITAEELKQLAQELIIGNELRLAVVGPIASDTPLEKLLKL